MLWSNSRPLAGLVVEYVMQGTLSLRRLVCCEASLKSMKQQSHNLTDWLQSTEYEHSIRFGYKAIINVSASAPATARTFINLTHAILATYYWVALILLYESALRVRALVLENGTLADIQYIQAQTDSSHAAVSAADGILSACQYSCMESKGIIGKISATIPLAIARRFYSSHSYSSRLQQTTQFLTQLDSQGYTLMTMVASIEKT